MSKTVLLTGAFGNIGQHTLTALLERGHAVRCFDVETPANRRAARAWSGRPGVETHWGDLRDPAAVAAAAQGAQVVLHLGFVIPRLSATGVNSEDRPDWARAINVGGTQHVIEAARAAGARLVFASSLHVYGPTQDQTPPRRAGDPTRPVEHYARHKVECEQLVHASGLTWSIFRLPATLPVRLILDPGMFEVPLDNRIEYAHGRDVGTAFAQAVDNPDIWNKTLLIGGGPAGQLIYGELMKRVLDTAGIGPLPEQAFTRTPYSVDWLDSAESQTLLGYQRRTLDDYLADLRRVVGWRRPFIVALRPLVRWWMLRQSPYWRQ